MECIPHQGDYLSQMCQVWFSHTGIPFRDKMDTSAAGIQCKWNLKCRNCIWLTNEGNVIFLFMYFFFLLVGLLGGVVVFVCLCGFVCLVCLFWFCEAFVCRFVLFLLYFFTCQFFCIPLEALILGGILLFSYTLWNSYVTNTTEFWMLQFFLQDKRSF